ncbi:MAG: hypothetical protein NZZ41_05490 [Candidatus Dojkabacteria bacterium]|nr:hypothetical protein [Candidatus Dojkabacteria bacterium]
MSTGKISVIFYKAEGGLFSKLIRFYKRTPYSHCEILFSNGFCGTSSEICQGVYYYIPDKKTLSEEYWDFIDIECDAEEETKMKDIFLYEECGCGYDWLGIFFCQVFPWGRQHSSKWFCSEICTYALKRIHHLKPVFENLKPHYIDPGELYEILSEFSRVNPKIQVRKKNTN